ncbi:MAG: acyl carrier protein [Lachnospiraceae bacterium]|nr:acyl carrier protein [Lachnospiraceae bacterium]
MKEKILAVLSENFPGIDFTKSDTLVDDEVIDSFKIIEVVTVLSENFNLEIPYDDISGENFNSLDSITKLVERCIKDE